MIAGLFPDPAESDRPLADASSGTGRDEAEASRKAILVVDDHADIARALRIAFDAAGYLVDIATGPEEALSMLAVRRYDAILLDLNFTHGRTNGDEGLGCLARIVADEPAACVIVITAHSGLRMAIAAMQAGARDFVTKPWRNAELVAKVGHAISRTRDLRAEAQSGYSRSFRDGGRGGAVLIGDSPAMAKLRKLVGRIGPTAAGVAISGPAGSGRSLVAKAIHHRSEGGTRELVPIDLRDTGSWHRLRGESAAVLLRHADRLDDIAQSRIVEELDPRLRAIAIIDDTLRLIPALRSRIAVVEIAVPPLRSREGDALLLANHFLRLSAERHRLPLPKLTPAAQELILKTEWPDEVRGLGLAIERAVVLATGSTIDALALAPRVDSAAAEGEKATAYDLARNEKAIISAALREHHHNVTQAAAALGLSRGSLYRRMERYGL